MNFFHGARWWRRGWLAAWLCGGLLVPLAMPRGAPAQPTGKQPSKGIETLPPPRRDRAKPKDRKFTEKERGEIEASLPPVPPSILPAEMNAIDLGCVLRLAGIENPNILIARQLVAVAEGQRAIAYAMILPNLNAGMNYDAHDGPVQQSSGNILKVNRDALYFGAGAGAVAAGTVGIPGVQYVLNVSEGLFGALSIRQVVRQRRFESLAVRNQMLLRVADAYMELLRAEGLLAIAIRNRQESHQIAFDMTAWTRHGSGAAADSERAKSQYARRIQDVSRAEGLVLVASANLAKLINLPPSILLHAIDGWVVPVALVPDTHPLKDLLLIAIAQRPELAARQAAIRAAVLQMQSAKYLILSPTILAGYSSGSYGGGSNLIGQPGGFQGFAESRFGSFAPREDIDVVMFWTARNLGVGNLAATLVRSREARVAELEMVQMLNRVRNDVATAYAQTHARFAQIEIARQGTVAGQQAYKDDYPRFENDLALPIELLNSFDLLAAARQQYLDAIVDYNKAQFALYVALGQPPPRFLAKEVPSEFGKTTEGNPIREGGMVWKPQPAPPLPACVPTTGAPGKPCIVNPPAPPALLPADAK